MPGKSKSNNKNKKMVKRSLGLLPRVTTTPTSSRILQTYSTGNTIAEAAAGTGASYFYRMNSVYDPDSSGVGSVAGGYSTWSALYLNYRVRRITARFQGTTVGANGSMIQVIIAPVASQAVIPSSPALWRVIPGARVYTCTPNANGGKSSFEHTASYDNAKVARITASQFDNDMDFSGSVGSNPARQMYLFIGIQSVGSGTAASANYAVQLTYEVEWFNPVPMQL